MYFQQYNKGIDKQVRKLKLIAAISLGMGLLIVTTMSSYYWDLYNRASAYDEGHATLTVNYDLCHGDIGTGNPDTHW